MNTKHKGYVSPNLIGEDAFSAGNVMVTRSRGGLHDIGIFLVDRFCLGVKNATFVGDCDDERIDEIRERFFEQGVEEKDGAWCRKFVEGAVAYARDLGFAPHGDYKKASRVFGGIKASDCTESFAYGKDGKPFYVQGPFEDDRAAERIMGRLRARCGEDGFHYVHVEKDFGEDLEDFDEAGDVGDVDAEDADEDAGGPVLQFYCECAGGGGQREFFEKMVRELGDERLPFTPELVFDPDECEMADNIEPTARILSEFGDSEDEREWRREVVSRFLVECLLAAAFNKKQRREFLKGGGVDPQHLKMLKSFLAHKEFYAWARSIVHYFPQHVCVLQSLGWAPPDGAENGESRLHVIYSLVPCND